MRPGPAQLADIERLRRASGETSLILIGHSFGAFLAALYATEFPERVRAPVLVLHGALDLQSEAASRLYLARSIHESNHQQPQTTRLRLVLAL